MSLSGIRSKISTALSGISGLEYKDCFPDVINPPVAFPALQPVEPLTYDFTSQNSSLIYHMYVEIVINKGGTIEQAQDDLDPYLQNSGSTSIKAAIEAVDWATTADCCRVTNVSNYGPIMYNGTEYFGARLNLDIWRSS
uniref:Putative tail protein n=1 Tax=viral metagenome TaxID=1070528 RepID=A0A6M3LPX5_9ZZZZ